MRESDALQSKLRAFIRTLPSAELGHDEMSEEAYFCGRANFVHFHGPRHVDIRLSLDDQKRALAEGIARPHMWAPRAGWVSCVLEDGKSLDDARQLVKRAYDHWDKIASVRRASAVSASGST